MQADANVVDMRDYSALAAMSNVDYALVRREEAKKRNIPVGILDASVKLARSSKSKDEKDEEKKPKDSQLQLSLDLLTTRLRTYCLDNDISFGFANGSWHIYRNGVWRPFILSDREDLDRILQQLCPEVGLVFGKDAGTIDRHLRASMHFRLDINQMDVQPYVGMRNGTLNVDTGKLEQHSPQHMTSRQIDVDFDADAECPEWEQMLEDILGDFDDVTRGQVAGFLQEWMGVALVGGSNERTPRDLRKALFLYGPPRAGKSTVYDVLRALLGVERIVASKVSEINGRFGLESFLSAQAWITEEVDDMRRDAATSRVKCLITGEPVTAQRKGEKDVVLKFNGPVGWAGNTAPNFTEASNAVYDRIVMIPMEQTFTAEQAKKKFGGVKPVEWLYERGEFPGIVNWALRGYYRLLERGHFEEIPDLKSAREEWREQNDAVFDFLRNYCRPEPGIRNSSEVLAWAIMGYIKSHTQRTWPEILSLQKVITNTMPDIYPDVIKHRRQTTAKRWTYTGIALTDAGLALFRQQEETVTSVKEARLRPNEKPLFGARPS